MNKNFILILSLSLLLCACSNKTDKKQEIPVTTVRHGTFYIDLYEEGEIQATQSVLIMSPDISWRYGNLKIATIAEDGTEVEAGDTVVTFDPSDVRKAIVDAEQSVELRYAEREKLEAQHKSNLESAISDLEVSRISLEISRINYESAQYEAEITKKEIQLNLEQAEIALQQAESQIENTKKIQREEMLQTNLTIKLVQTELEEAKATLEKMSVTAPSAGIVIIEKNRSTDAKYQEGDQVWGGMTLIELPNLHQLKAELKVNEVDISKVKKGLKVLVRPDAFSDSTYNGEVISVANLAINKSNSSKIKVFPVDVLITSPINVASSQTPELMPGLTVSCRIIVDEIPDVTYIPLNCLFQDGEDEVVYLKTVSGFRMQKVKTGQRNTDYVIIEEGLDSNDEISMVNPLLVTAEKDKNKKEAK